MWPVEGHRCWPEITGNTLRIKPVQTLMLMRSNLNATDTDSRPLALTYHFSGVSSGFFAHRDNPGTAITGFTQAEVDGGVFRFVHAGGAVVPSSSVTLSDGTNETAPSTVSASLI